MRSESQSQALAGGPQLIDRHATAQLSIGRTWPFLLTGFLAVALLRLQDIYGSLWMDEAYSAWFAALPLGVLWTEVPLYETHPPIFYTLLKGVTMFGTSEVALRLPSVLFSLAVVPVAWRILAELPVRRGSGFSEAGLLAALMCGLSAIHISYAQEARPYAALTLAFALMMLFVLRWLRHLDEPALTGPGSFLGIRWSSFLGLVLTGAAVCWLHNVGPLFVTALMAPLGVVMLARCNWRGLAAQALASLAILALFAPYVRFMILRAADWGSGTWASPLTPYRARVIIQDLLNPISLHPDGVSGVIVCAVVLGLAGLGLWIVVRRVGPAAALLLACAVGVPVIGAIVASLLIGPVFAARISLPVTVPIFLLVSIACWTGFGHSGRPFIVAIVVTTFVGGALKGYESRPNEAWDRLTQSLIKEAQAEEIVLVARNDVALGLLYYLRRSQETRALRPLPAPYPAIGLPNRYINGSPALPEVSEADIERILRETAADPVIWVVERGNGATNLREALRRIRPEEKELVFQGGLRLTRYGPVAQAGG